VSLDISLYYDVNTDQKELEWHIVWEGNITHNLTCMARKAGIYYYAWRPEECGIVRAFDLVLPLYKGIKKLKSNPAYFRKFNPPNNWGSYETLLEFVKAYRYACR
jgi:hypothetical protein